MVYELFYTALPQKGFTPADIVALYLHRGAFETVLSDEDQEQATSRWYSHTPWGQEFWLILAQWIWNLRLESGHALHPTPMCTNGKQGLNQAVRNPTSLCHVSRLVDRLTCTRLGAVLVSLGLDRGSSLTYTEGSEKLCFLNE